MNSDTFKEFSDQDLLGELRRRGYVLSAWSVEDARSAIENGDEDYDEALVQEMAEALLDRSDRQLEDILGSRGNEALSDMWAMFKDEIVQQATAPKA